MRIYDIISEGMPRKQYRSFRKEIGDFDRSKFAPLFKKYATYGKAYRIYLDAPNIKMDSKTEMGNIENEVRQVLQQYDYELLDYRGNKATKSKSSGDKSAGQPLKLGKVLQKLNPDLFTKYVQDNDTKKMAKQATFKVCISRHQYDIASMSTGQSWTSCMNVDTGSNSHMVPQIIRNGTLVAYLIRANDLKLEKPLARMLVIPFVSSTGEVQFKPSTKVYPEEYRNVGFKEVVQKWVTDANAKMETRSALFKIQSGHYEPEVDTDNIHRIDKNTSENDLIDLVSQDGGAILYIKDPSEEVQKAAVSQRGGAIMYIKDPSEEVQKAAVSQNGGAILYIKDPSEEVQKAAVSQNGYAIEYIKNPSVEAKRIAREKWGLLYEDSHNSTTTLTNIHKPDILLHITNLTGF